MASEPKWYVVHTYSGYENNVKANIEKIIANRGMYDYIVDMQVPLEEVTEIKDGKKRTVIRKKFPGYLMIKMILTDETWYVVRNSRGVTGFVGAGSKPEPLSDEEIEAMGVESKSVEVPFKVGDMVKVKQGALEGFDAVVDSINFDKRKAVVFVSMFGRETKVEIDFEQVDLIE